MTSKFTYIPTLIHERLRGPSDIRVIVAGSRTFKDYGTLHEGLTRLEEVYNIKQIVSGTAKGADSLGEKYAKENGIDIARFPADWDAYGKKAGYLRNTEMAHYADVLLVFWDGKSKGTQHMIKLMLKKQKPILLYTNDKWYVYKGK